MKRRLTLAATATALVAGMLAAGPQSVAAPNGNEVNGLEVYTGVVSLDQLDKIRALGLDHEDISQGKAANGKIAVEVVMTNREAKKLDSEGVSLSVKLVKGKKASQSLREKSLAGATVYRSYSEPGGLRDELIGIAAANPGLTKLVNLGNSLQGKPILGIKLTKDARSHKDGLRPAVMYIGAQHAREWITPEMVRRLLHYYLDGYGTDPVLTRIVNTTELWFVPVSNPDGYDLTFLPDNRLWRKNAHDNNGDGVMTVGVDGVDPNRNFAERWGYDNEGSSPSPSSETYRGPGPNSEPETKAMDGLFKRLRPKFLIDYHSAAELLLYGVGWQVSTPSPDDVIYRALAGTDEHNNSAIPGYDPDISAELYTTNGETDGHAQSKYGTLSFTPEMSTCQTASNINPDDQWKPEDCESVFNFPDDEALIQAEFEKNIPFALAVAKSAQDPDDPQSSVGLKAADLTIDPFAVSYGSTQPVAVIAKHALLDLRLKYSINGGATKSVTTSLWNGGKRYGDGNNDYLGEYRGTVTGTHPGDSVKVWFTGVKPKTGTVSSESFTYTVASDIGGDVLIVASEDETGRSPGAPRGTQGEYADDYATSLAAAGYSSDVYDVDLRNRTAPHHLGVLSHYKAVVWERGDDIITRAQGQPAGTAAKLELDLELTMRDYLNEGGELLYTGKYAGFDSGADGAYYYNPFLGIDGQGECTTPGAYPCLPLLNDFLQYWLGAYTYVDNGGSDPDTGSPYPVSGAAGTAFGGFDGTFNGGDSADNQDHTADLLVTSSILPPAQFPQFASSKGLDWDRPFAAPFDPYDGSYYLNSQWADVSYKRLTQTVDLTGRTGGELSFRVSHDTETDWDYFFVEAHEVGTDNWTTLPDANGHTAQDTGESCASGWRTLHPQLNHYQGADCSPVGTTGVWNAATGSSAGWQQWSVDLSPYAGKQVELSLTYASDWATQKLGVFLDNVSVSADGQVLNSTSFETDLGAWSVPGAPPGSRPNANDWIRSQQAFQEGSGVLTEDTVYVGFGAEGLTTQAMRDDFVKRSMQHLLGG